MQTIDKIEALESFRKYLPLTNLVQYEDELRYRFKREASAKHFEKIAIELILENGLPLVASIETWSRRGIPFEINLVIEMAQEEYDFADEAGDEYLLNASKA